MHQLIKKHVAIASFGLLFKIHTQMLQHKAAFKKESADKNKKILLNT
jgi:hypothetical protein